MKGKESFYCVFMMYVYLFLKNDGDGKEIFICSRW